MPNSQPRLGVYSLVKDRLARYGTISAAKGVAIALGVKAVSDVRGELEERNRKKFLSAPKIEARSASEAQQGDQEEGRKVASKTFSAEGGWFGGVPRGPVTWDLPVSIAAMTLPGVATYTILSNYLDNREKSQLEREIRTVKSRHLDKITHTRGQESVPQRDVVDEVSDEVSDSVSDLPNIVKGGLDKITGSGSEPSRKAAVMSFGDKFSRATDFAVGGMVLTTVAAGILTHRSRLQKERDLDDLYISENRKQFREKNPDLLMSSVSIGEARSMKGAASVLQNTLIALNLQEFSRRSNDSREQEIGESAREDSDEVSLGLEEDLMDIGVDAHPLPITG